MASPRVSIGIPVYNGENFLDEALRSIREQTFTDFEVVISDNCSTDGTRQIAERHAREDDRFRYVRQPRNLGAVPNFNAVFGLTKADLFKWTAHDDVLHREYLEKVVAALDERPEVVLAHARAEVIDERGETIERYDADVRSDSASVCERFRDLLLSWHRCYEIFGVVRARALRETDLLDIYWGADRTLLQELALQGPFYEVPEYLFHPRTHATQSITSMKGDNVERAYWSDAKMKGRIVLPSWSVVAGNVEVIRRASLSSREKARLYRYVGTWSRQHWRELARDVARAGRRVIRRNRG